MLTVRATSAQAWLDVAVPALLAVLAVTQLVVDEPPGDPALMTVCALVTVLPLAARRRAPVLVTAVVGAGTVGQVLAADGAPATFASFVAVMVCVYTLAREARPVGIAAGLAIVTVAVTVLTLLQARAEPFQPFEFVYPLFYFGAAGALGALVRRRSERLAAVEDRAVTLERELQREAELAAAEERARIARELHDVVAHGLSLMVVQAEAAEELLGRSPTAAAQPLQRVQETGRQALAEMRRLLGVLRDPEAGPPATAPQPSLRRLPDLVREAADVGLRVDVEVAGEQIALSPGLELAVYRIVQEALTNTRRHAGASRACVQLAYSPEALRIEVTDDGRGPTGNRDGHGLIGMRERAALYGGTLEAGPADTGGFRVAAVLPLEDGR
ncbi:sensor histidine kinase [Blastococcus sp. PRF04-17]|uniref:sensor histidine kinase n=1 Tax=Blastococcus sp. PRF04-17 TaxID=2933797 RepID=UPI001FF4C12E|nr:histidine kinase [Blastococcus sp. PRF04-17]UOY00435.1 histidine kinase [Blastococcus sp. PRF04-17]